MMMVTAKKPGSPEEAKKGTTSMSCSKGSHLPNMESHAVGRTAVKFSPGEMQHSLEKGLQSHHSAG